MKKNFGFVMGIVFIILICFSIFYIYKMEQEKYDRAINDNDVKEIYKVTYIVDGNIYYEENIKNNKIESLKIPTKEGYTFLYWELNGKKVNVNDTITQNVTLNAVFEKNKEQNNNEGHNDNNNENQNIDINSLSIINNVDIQIGEVISLNVVINPTNASNKTLTWTSSDESVVTVNNGIVKGIKEGTAIISVKSNNGKVATCKVTVLKKMSNSVEVSSITLNKTNETMDIGKELQLTATINPTNASNKTLTWTSSDNSVATVNNGIVKGIKEGTAIISVKSNNGKVATCKVTVLKKISNSVEVSSITLDKTNVTMDIGNELQLTATINPTNATNKTIIWTSSDNSVATVNNGIVKGIKEGTATISVKSNNGKVATCKVTVLKKISNSVEVSSITLDKTNVTIDTGNELQLTATINPTNATNKTIIWTSSDENVARVNNGKITAISAGTTTITAKSNNGKTATAIITVKENINNYADVYFINTYNQKSILKSLVNTDDKDGYNNGQSIIIKSYDDKYILIDTSFNNSSVSKIIYNNLKKIQGKKKVNIDYMIITHSHGDHSGGAVKLIDNSNITVNKLIMKNESKSPNAYNKISSKFASNKIVKLKEEGQKVSLGKYLEIYLFNISDVYKNKTCHTGKSIRYVSNLSKAEKINGKYYYFDGSTYPNISLVGTKVLKEKTNGDSRGLNRYYYAAVTEESGDCNANSNSLAILIKVKTDNGNRYIYFPGDIDNGGYSLFGESGIYGNGATKLYSEIKFSKGKFTGETSYNKIKSETNVSKRIKNLLGDELNNISIYQVSHHGYNNGPDAINNLNLNRSTLYAVYPFRFDPSTSINFLQARTYYYTLSKSKKLYAGGTDKGGIYCNIENTGKYLCREY